MAAAAALHAASGSGGAAPAASPEAAAAADQLKDQGNAQHRSGNFLKAAALYTQGLKADPTNAVLYSNRSASLLQLSKTTKALADAEECIRLRPEWDKGYFRKAAVLEALERLDEVRGSVGGAWLFLARLPCKVWCSFAWHH
jgi:tetratricopeptide (TPR) repeat protein